MLEVSLFEVWEQFKSYGPVVWIGVFCAVFTYVIEIRLYQKDIIFSSGKKKLDRAKKMGHVIEAKMVKCRSDDDVLSNGSYISYFEYQVDGNIRKKRIITRGFSAPSTMMLYYVDSPDKVFSEYDVGSSRLEVLVFIVPIIVAYIVMKLLGYQG